MKIPRHIWIPAIIGAVVFVVVYITLEMRLESKEGGGSGVQ